jgi:hypothetical protein
MKLPLALFVLVACPVSVLVALGTRDFGNAPQVSPVNAEVKPLDRNAPFAQRRAAFRTKLLWHGSAPQEAGSPRPPHGVDLVTYQSGKLELKAWIAFPRYRASRHPALVYLHGGFALGPSDLNHCRPFLDEGYVVMCPMLRGENGNPGDFEMFFGEVEDAKAAIHWLSQQPFVQTGQVYVFGHSAGGAISALLSLVDDVPVRLTGSAGGLYGPETFDAWSDFVPFDMNDPQEREMRLLLGNVRHMQRSHYAYIGRLDRLQRHLPEFRREMSVEGSRLVLFKTAGDHLSCLRPALIDFLRVIRIRNRIR